MGQVAAAGQEDTVTILYGGAVENGIAARPSRAISHHPEADRAGVMDIMKGLLAQYRAFGSIAAEVSERYNIRERELE